MEYLKYEKAFIMLEEQGKDFAAKLTVPVKGHAKVETGNGKGAIRINVQNLKYFESGSYIYKLILFGKRREKTIYATIGTVVVGKQGGGETYFRFNPQNLDGNDHELSEFSHVIVAALPMRNDKEALHPVLVGTLEMPFLNSAENGRRSEVKAAEYSREVEDAAEEEEEFREEEEFMEKPDENIQVRTYNEFYKKYLVESSEALWVKAENYEDVIPFREDKTRAQWKKVNTIGTLPIVSPGARFFSSKYKHYIFGENNENYYYGIPGRFLREEQPDRGLSGFVFWQPIMGAEKLGPFEAEMKEEKYKTAYGYWIAAVNKETGDIIEA